MLIRSYKLPSAPQIALSVYILGALLGASAGGCKFVLHAPTQCHFPQYRSGQTWVRRMDNISLLLYNISLMLITIHKHIPIYMNGLMPLLPIILSDAYVPGICTSFWSVIIVLLPSTELPCFFLQSWNLVSVFWWMNRCMSEWMDG